MSIETYGYDSYGNATDDNLAYSPNSNLSVGNQTVLDKTYTYDSNYNTYIASSTVNSVKNIDGTPSNITSSAIYDIFGQTLSATDPNSNTTNYQYDNACNITQTTYPNDSVSTATYNYSSNFVTTVNMDGTGSKTVYDPLGNVTYKYRLNSNQSSYDLLSQMTYDNLNRLSIQTDYLNTSQSKKDTTYTYDAEGRITDTTVKDESTIIVGEQKNSFTQAASQGASSNKYNITETTNITGQGNNNVTTAYNDELGRTKSNETSNISGGINVTYTDNNTYNNFNILTGIDGGQSSTVNSQQYQYDASGRNQEVLDGTNVHLDQTTSQINSYSQHDGINNNITATDAMGNNSNTTYDILGRGIEVDTPFETYNSITYYSKKKTYYDGSGNITEVKQTNNAVGSSEALNNDTKYTYDNMGRLIMTELIIDGTHSQFTQNYYDSQGRLRRVYTGLNKALTINGLDNVTSGGDNNYSVTKYTYDFYGRLTTYTERNRLVLS